jgi:NnrS protein
MIANAMNLQTDTSIAPDAPAGPRADMMIPDLLLAHPHARAVFDRYGLRGCGGRHGPAESVGFFARAHGVDEPRLLRELRQAIDSPAPLPPLPPSDDRPALEDTIYRRYFTGGIVLILTAGATWGAWLLWKIGLSGRFTGASLHEVNAHGHAQIYGWVGLFIMGFAYQAFPRMWQTSLVRPRLAAAAFAAMVAGLAVRTVGMTLAGKWAGALPAAMAGGALELAAVAVFTGQIVATFRRSRARLEPYVGFVLMALVWFVAMSLMDVWHTYTTMTAADRKQLLWYVSTYQAPLRDLQIHGLALFMILGVSMRMLPAIFGLPPVPAHRGWWALGVLTAAVAGEAMLFVAYRWTGSHAIAGLLLVLWLMLAVGCAMVAWPWRLWRPLPAPNRSGKFVRAAYAWLAVSMAMLLLLPAYQLVSRVPFSHAYYGGIRHAITVGFISLMIMGMAAKVVPTLNGVDPRGLSALWGAFILVNLGCFLRVSTQILTDWHGGFFAVVGVSGTLEVIGLTWWGLGLLAIMRQGKRAAGEMPIPTSPPPAAIGAGHYVTDVLAWCPAAAPVFEQYGFGMLNRPFLRRTLACGVTVQQAAAFRGVPLELLLYSLNTVFRGGASLSRRPPARVTKLPILLPLVVVAFLASPSLASDDQYEQDPINYSTAPVNDPVARLQKRIDDGQAKFDFDPNQGYLPALLKELNAPVSSQTLVFSRTSFQRGRISPKKPRALYFGDDAYVGWAKGGDVLEVASVDPQQGVQFYTLEQKPTGKPAFVRETHNCLQCHAGSLTDDMPGLLLRSVFPDSAGDPILPAGTFVVTHETPFKERWGGWYVTGKHGDQHHMGNQTTEEETAEKMDLSKGGNVTDLAGRFDASAYLSPHSDVVALMVLEHQAEAHNRIARANYLTRLAIRDSDAMNEALGEPKGHRSESALRRIKSACEPLVEYLLFAKEAKLTGRIEGTSDFAKEYASRGPRDSKGRSLRDLDLTRRLLKHPCSPVIYGDAFDALPPEANQYVYRRLLEVLTGKDTSETFAHLSTTDRRTILEILRDTKEALPDEWNAGP